MRREVRSLLATAAAFALATCGGDGSTDPTGDGGGDGGGGGGGGNGGAGGSTAAAISAVSGSAQSGKTLEALGSPFVVRVTDDGGAAVSGVTVSWSVTSGDGTLSTSTSSTDASGEASVTYTPGVALGPSTIIATVSGVSQTAEFTIQTTIALVKMQGIAFVSPQGGDALTVPVGTTVEWVNLDGVSHTVTSTDVPAGGPSFDSGLMSRDDRFRFTPESEGTWTYFCEVHPGIMVGATLTAVSGSSSIAKP